MTHLTRLSRLEYAIDPDEIIDHLMANGAISISKSEEVRLL